VVPGPSWSGPSPPRRPVTSLPAGCVSACALRAPRGNRTLSTLRAERHADRLHRARAAASESGRRWRAAEPSSRARLWPVRSRSAVLPRAAAPRAGTSRARAAEPSPPRHDQIRMLASSGAVDATGKAREGRRRRAGTSVERISASAGCCGSGCPMNGVSRTASSQPATGRRAPGGLRAGSGRRLRVRGFPSRPSCEDACAFAGRRAETLRPDEPWCTAVICGVQGRWATAGPVRAIAVHPDQWAIAVHPGQDVAATVSGRSWSLVHIDRPWLVGIRGDPMLGRSDGLSTWITSSRVVSAGAWTIKIRRRASARGLDGLSSSAAATHQDSAVMRVRRGRSPRRRRRSCGAPSTAGLCRSPAPASASAGPGRSAPAAHRP
jgi:hypothetical protein